MAKAIETGIPKMRIEEASARKQARLDSGQDILVGVNKFRTDEKSNIEILEVDNSSVRLSQMERLKKLRASRNQDVVDANENVDHALPDKLEGPEKSGYIVQVQRLGFVIRTENKRGIFFPHRFTGLGIPVDE